MNAIDLFAGAGGWDEGARPLGITPLGIETEPAMCATRRLVGHPTLQADVAKLDPLDFEPCDLFIASPPCQARSGAGLGLGVHDIQTTHEVMRAMVVGEDRRDAECVDPRSMLIVEPLRWILALRPRFVALEQVPPVIDDWHLMAHLLREVGYGTWVGHLDAERYGVPQTRRRAFLLAAQGETPHPPVPTHLAFGEADAGEGLFGQQLLPCVTMAEAIGWGTTQRPAPTVMASSGSGGPKTLDGGAGARAMMANERAKGAWAQPVSNGRSREDVDHHPPSEVLVTANALDHSAVRRLDEPAFTIKGGNDYCDRRYITDSGFVAMPAQDAAILQTFPADYPWQGNLRDKYQQIGNAVPPKLATAVLAALLSGTRCGTMPAWNGQPNRKAAR